METESDIAGANPSRRDAFLTAIQLAPERRAEPDRSAASGDQGWSSQL